MTTTATNGARKRREPLPEWFKIKLPAGAKLAVFQGTHNAVQDNRLHTVCSEAGCPNIHDCWSRGTATFMIAGKTCTRNCRFCSVEHERRPAPPDPGEPASLTEAIETMKLAYAVITVVNRDDLPDGGAAHYRACLDAVHARLPHVGLELLCSDLSGNEQALAALLHNAPLKVFAHNVETVERLTTNVRDRKASFSVSTRILAAAKQLRPDILTKSSIMVGLGETTDDMTAAMRRLREAGVDILTLGQYLAPSSRHYPVISFPDPAQFDHWREEALALGFLAVASGPLVRSSFRAGTLYAEARRAADDPDRVRTGVA